MSFVHLHVHTNFSFGDGACRIDELVATAAEAGMAAVACTDHDGLYGAVRFYQACQKAGIKPIMGVELNVQSVLEADRQAQMGGAGRAPAAPLTVAEMMGFKQGLGWLVGQGNPGGYLAAIIVFSIIIAILFKVKSHVLFWQKGLIQ